MNVLTIVNELGLSITNAQCLEIIKDERNKAARAYEEARANEQAMLYDIREPLHKIQAYDAVIEQYERYLNHDA